MANETNQETKLTPAEVAERREITQTLIDKFDVLKDALVDIAEYTNEKIAPARPLLALMTLLKLAEAKDVLAPVVIGATNALAMSQEEIEAYVAEYEAEKSVTVS